MDSVPMPEEDLKGAKLLVGTSPKHPKNWFDMTAAEDEECDHDLLESSIPRSTLRLVDEALEFELGGLGIWIFWPRQDPKESSKRS